MGVKIDDEFTGGAETAEDAENKYAPSQDENVSNGHRECRGHWTDCAITNCRLFSGCVLTDTAAS
jgi:hypothetical protein